MSVLSKDAQDLLARARAVPPLGRGRQIKVRAALLGQIALAPATGAAAGALGKLGLAKALLVVSAIGVAGTGTLIAARSRDDAPTKPDRSAPVSHRLPAPSLGRDPRAATPAKTDEAAARLEQTPAPRDPTEIRDPVRAVSRAATKKTGASEPVAQAVAQAPPAAKTNADTLREEIELVKSANALLRDGKPEQARALLDQHSEKFASGALREEREAARILALCALGKEREAQAAAARFLQESPRSMQAAHVRASCARKGSSGSR